MSLKKIIVFIKVIGVSSLQSSTIKKLSPDDHLPDIRKELENNDIINDMLLFSIKENDEFGEIGRKEEKNFNLKEIITINDDRNILYLKRLTWKFLSSQCELNFGRTMSSNGIKTAKKPAFEMKDCILNEINKFNRGELVFGSKEDWMKKKNLFINVDGIKITNFVHFGLSVESSQNENINEEVNSTFLYTEVGKVSLKFSKENLELTDDFKDDVNNAIQSKDLGDFRKITEKYGQFIPTKVILGGRVYFKQIAKSIDNSTDCSKGGSVNASIGSSTLKVGYNSSESERNLKFYNFNHTGLLGGNNPDDEKAWIESLKNYQNWKCIEFKDPINIFQLLPDDLRKGSFKSIGKKVLYKDINNCYYNINKPGSYRNFELKELKNIPQNILDTIQNEEADCDIFAAVFDTNEESKKVFFNCQILRRPNMKPSIIIHGIQKNFQRCKYNLKIKIMVVGYDIDFNIILPDMISVDLIKEKYDSQGQLEFDSIPLQRELSSMMTNGIPFFGIPILDNLENNSIVIGHNFCDTQNNKCNIDVFSYCVKKKCYYKLPKLTFCTLIISDFPASNFYRSLSFNFKILKTPFIGLDPCSINPKCISLYLTKNDNYNNYKPIFLDQKIKQIKIKYVDCNCKKTCFICKNKTVRISKDENNAECIFFEII
ncbi:hypothetical protein C1645_853340 [Glomus cerebriforme]|uniref:Uncharacterized protein n=1 Tax=Glomus cerebriforme TaxID=658196 RepID=A0A397SP87_9GLOM|nr:hypothetical protein C1645_853340 [Glomus cerebriforme]